MKITDAFVGEHAILYTQFDHLDEAVLKAITLAEVKAQGAMLAVALRSHADLEEELLFKPMEEYTGSAESLKDARADHNKIEKLMSEMLDHLTDVHRLGHARRLLLQVLETSREHFGKEEASLFPEAEKVLGVEKLSEFGDKWAGQRNISID